jgi:leucyl-tRNA synthetase
VEAAAVFGESVTAVIHLIAPFLPHLAEELWAQTGHDDLVCQRAWPQADAALLVDNVVTLAVQINGKLRDTLALPRDTDSRTAEIHALALPSVADALKDRQVKKIIVVPNRIVNVVAQ